MTAAGRHSSNVCPHCGASPRYGLEGHVLRCSKHPKMEALINAAIDDAAMWHGYPQPAEVLPDVPKGHCQKCGKHIGKGLHFHQRACKGAA